MESKEADLNNENAQQKTNANRSEIKRSNRWRSEKRKQNNRWWNKDTRESVQRSQNDWLGDDSDFSVLNSRNQNKMSNSHFYFSTSRSLFLLQFQFELGLLCRFQFEKLMIEKHNKTEENAPRGEQQNDGKEEEERHCIQCN